MRRRWILAVALGALALVLGGCDISLVGFDITTRIDAEGAGTFVIEAGFVEEGDDEVECGSGEELPTGGQVRTETRGSEVWCIITIPFSDMAGLRALHQEMAGEAIVNHCLDYSGAQVIYDVELVSDEPFEQPIVWQVEVPGLIESTNGTQSGQSTVTWEIYGTQRMQINSAESDVCPSDVMRLTVFVNEDGTGSATLRVPLIGDTERNEAVAAVLAGAGWAVSGPTAAGEGSSQMEASRNWDSESGFAGVFASIPGVDGSSRGMALSLVEDSATGQTEITMEGSLFFTEYAATWEGLWPDHEPPPFFLDYLPPGVTETVVGRWTNPDLLEYLWTPESGTGPISLQAVSVIQPDTDVMVDEATLEENTSYILERFENAIPQGQIVQDPSALQQVLSGVFGPGIANNMTNWTTYACGDYQTRVLEVLDKIRTSPDPEIRARLGGLDYGPVQAYRGGHQAVVLFPRGTDWRETGTVLDPWPNQRPETYSMEEWNDRFSWGVGPGEGAGDYPHLFGNPPHYGGTSIARGREHPRRIGVNSPVAVMVVAADGRRLGMDEAGEFIVEIEHADFYPVPKGNGEFQWYFGLPEGEYEVVLTGTGEGEAHILVGDENNQVLTYGPQPIEPGQVASLEISPAEKEPGLSLPSGETAAPLPLTEENLAQIDLGEPPREVIGATTGGRSSVSTPARFGYLALLALCLGLPLGGGWLALTARARSKS